MENKAVLYAHLRVLRIICATKNSIYYSIIDSIPSSTYFIREGILSMILYYCLVHSILKCAFEGSETQIQARFQDFKEDFKVFKGDFRLYFYNFDWICVFREYTYYLTKPEPRLH